VKAQADRFVLGPFGSPAQAAPPLVDGIHFHVVFTGIGEFVAPGPTPPRPMIMVNGRLIPAPIAPPP
jgi:hypothetical protein